MTKKKAERKSQIANRKKQVSKQKTINDKRQAKSKLTAQVFNFSGKTTRTTLPDEIFKVDVAPNTLAQAIRVYLVNMRKGTVSTKTRGEVSGGGRKPWRQKGTGRARQGSIRAPHWRGGGVVFGPRPRNFELSLPKKVKQLVLSGAISQKFVKGEVKVVDGFEKLKPKTKELAKVIEKLNLSGRKILWIINGRPENLIKAGRNLPNLEFSSVENLNTYQVLKAATLVFNKDAVEKLTLRLRSVSSFDKLRMKERMG